MYNTTVEKNKIFLPYLAGCQITEIASADIILYGRMESDYMKDCLLFKEGKFNALTEGRVREMKSQGFTLCYIYDVFDMNNYEFTITGYKAIRKDIERIIKSGFSHILLSNPYLIELVLNEYEENLKVIISSQLEINSARGKAFFDVLNSTSSISHIIVSQNHLTKIRVQEILSVFSGVQIVIEIDRWASNNQIIHENYYNIVYGHHTLYALQAIRNLTRRDDIIKYLKCPEEMVIINDSVSYKMGEINMHPDLLKSNLAALLNGQFDKIKIIDLYLWQAASDAAILIQTDD